MAQEQRKFSANADIANNRLYISLTGRLDKKGLDNLYTDIRFCVADLQPGFNVITDLSKCPLAALSGLTTFTKITDFLLSNKVGKVIRIIDERKIIFKQILNATAALSTYSPIYVNNFEEAEHELSALIVS